MARIRWHHLAVGLLIIATGLGMLGGDEKAETILKIEFQFKSEEYRQGSIYSSMAPIIWAGLERGEVTKTVVSDGRLIIEARFSNFTPSRNETFELDLGPKRLKFVARPVVWSQPDINGWKTGTMAPVLFLQQPDPDWMTLEKAQWLVTAADHMILELTLHNFSALPHAGVEVNLGGTEHNNCLMADRAFAEIEIRFSFQKGVLTLLSSDPEFGELIRRPFTFEFHPCGTTGFWADLGPTGSIAARQIFRIRYRFPPTIPIGKVISVGGYPVPLSENGQIAFSTLLLIGGGDPFRRQEPGEGIQVRLDGERVYPQWAAVPLR